MVRLLQHRRPRRMYVAILFASVVGVAGAGLVGMATAKTITLQVGKNATVMSASGSTSHENIVVNSKGRAVYTLSGDTERHPECTQGNGCFGFWPPVTVSSAKGLSKAAGIKGKLGTWKRSGITQVTLNGHPLYTYSADMQKLNANGEGIHGFGGTWHVIKGSASGGHTTGTSTPTPAPIPGY
jgi:predicted lipoprotein with Yx(FWY)xxD motif